MKQTLTIQSIDDLKEGDVFGGFVIQMPYKDSKDASLRSCRVGVIGMANLHEDQLRVLIAGGFNTVQREVERYTVRECQLMPWGIYDNAGNLHTGIWAHSKPTAEFVCRLLTAADATALNKLEEAS
jgi:hypothetical protein